jgi:hypothetical protein
VCFEGEEMLCLMLLQASRWPYVLRCDEHFVKEHIVFCARSISCVPSVPLVRHS